MTSRRQPIRRAESEPRALAPTEGAPPEASEPRAFTELYEAYAGRVYGYLRARVSANAEAEDLAARTFANAFTHLDQYRARGGGFGAWLMAIAHNLLVNWYRDRGRQPPSASLDEALELPSELPGPETYLEHNDRMRSIRAAIALLTADQQRLIALKYVDRLTNAEIGRMMGRSEGAVKALHHRTLRKLQALLADLVDA